MKRGDIIIVREPGSPASKGRPCVVIQHSGTLEAQVSKVTVCGLTSRLEGAPILRPLIEPTGENGLRKSSAVEIDWVYTHPITMIAGVVGTLDHDTMMNIDVALRDWLDL